MAQWSSLKKWNTYDMLQNEDGVWISCQNKLEKVVTSFYKSLFTDDGMAMGEGTGFTFPGPIPDYYIFTRYPTHIQRG